MADAVLVTQERTTLVVAINRPAARNAINRDVATRIGAAMDQLEESRDLRVGVLTGVAPGFCAGMDLKSFVSGDDATARPRGFGGLVERPPTKPLIAAVEGFAIAGGFELALACDLVVAARGAYFALPEVKRGLVASGGALLRLQQSLSIQLSMQLALVGEPIEAERLFELGLVSQLGEPGDALARALELADAIAANGPLAVTATKSILRSARDWGEGEFFARQEPLADSVMRSSDALEGAIAFTEGRPPHWTGR